VPFGLSSFALSLLVSGSSRVALLWRGYAVPAGPPQAVHRRRRLGAQQTLLTGGVQQGPHLFSSLVAVDKQLQVRRNNGAGLFAAVTQQETGRHLSDGGSSEWPYEAPGAATALALLWQLLELLLCTCFGSQQGCRVLGMQSIRGVGLLVKQACEVMLRNSTLLAALLKEEACNGCLNKAVLVPLRMVGDKNSHGAM